MSVRFVSSEPRLAQVLEAVDFGILPRDVREWAIGWMKDVGKVVRSREMMVSFVASLVYYTGFLSALSAMEKLGFNIRLPLVRRLTGW
jgi:hypothetical protein